MGIIAALVPYLPVILDLVGFFFRWFGASEKNLAEYQKMVENAAKEGLISVESHDRLMNHKKAIEARLAAKNSPSPDLSEKK